MHRFKKLPANQAPSFFGQGGRFVFDGQKLLATLKTQSTGLGNELWLADANNTLAATDVILTEAFDDQSDWMTSGDPLRWLKANIVMALKNPDFKKDLIEYFKTLI